VGQSVRQKASQSRVTMNPVLCSSKSHASPHVKQKENAGVHAS
jgi:hypothetical protein